MCFFIVYIYSNTSCFWLIILICIYNIIYNIYTYISINGRQINYKYIIAINSFMCVITNKEDKSDCDNTHETINSYNVFVVYLSTIY